MKLKESVQKALRWPLVIAMIAVTGLVVVPTLAVAQANASTQRTASTTDPKPTIVLVHGGWADGSSWDQVIASLQREGYTVDAPPNPLRGLKSDSAYLASYLSTISGPIVLVGHSVGGMVISNAATGNPNVKGLVYVDAFEPAAGETVAQLTFSRPGSCLSGGGDLSNVFSFRVDPSQPPGDFDVYLKIPPGIGYAGFDHCFATFVPGQQAAVLGATQRPIALDFITDPSGTPAWASTPSWAVIGTQDQVIPPAELTFMAQRANSQITYVDAGHLSMITQPGAVAHVITEAAIATG
jgi:pimeloyl-ACP methyl ester carboxylesterase